MLTLGRGPESTALALIVLLGVALWPGSAPAAEAVVAVAANFAGVMERLEADFEAETGHRLAVTPGSTGKLYAQIRHGAPFDAFLAANQQHPARLEQAGHAVEGSRFTYAVGRLTLWSRDPQRISGDGAATLRAGDFRRLAMANPELAPYGAAALETLKALGLHETLRDRIVRGENVGQAHALVATGNAELGFVALSYVVGAHGRARGSRWDVPPQLYEPIRQDAVLLRRGERNAAARDFLAYLRRPDVQALMVDYGYAPR